MSTSYTSKAIVLAKQPYSQWAQFYIVYAQDYGKMKVLCRGSKKITSKLASHLEPITLSDICFVRGRRHVQLIGSKKREAFHGIFEHYGKLTHACYILELVNTLVRYEEPDKALYTLLEQCLYVLHYSESDYDVISNAFGFLLLTLLGFTPEMNSCTMCNIDYNSPVVHFSVREGGVVCDTCFSQKHSLSTLRINRNHINDLDTLITQHFSAFEKEQGQYNHLLPLLKQFINYYTDKKLKTIALL